jgi:hypothetical protein
MTGRGGRQDDSTKFVREKEEMALIEINLVTVEARTLKKIKCQFV